MYILAETISYYRGLVVTSPSGYSHDPLGASGDHQWLRGLVVTSLSGYIA